ncbi:MAG TPA: class I SAM-dependent methyltransferase [Bryobacteraceae bacterium]|nr:class I SAM-dependent methyltransferase [Bryobacteraceae bacterium]HOQ45936.1 class I SAM-dependent methyltransferase [Bryobacteraceae bacterium]HPQ17143.1 class I SAM-dependent methyltransferase [Bryobacteraceae bacterium]HPU73245.1 class I SAM-dependent methyltransferase [Bryobacteraceae bacterium]
MKRTYFNELAPRWDELPAPPDAPEKVAHFTALAVPPGASRILDVGCGTGILVEHLGRNCAAFTVELDMAERMLALNRARSNGPRFAHVCGDALHPPFAPGSFDAVLCFNVLPHFEPPERTLCSLVECLCPGGLLSVGHLMDSAALNAFHASLGGAVANDRLPPAPELAGLLESMGTEVIRSEEWEGWYLVQARRS